MVPPTTTAMSPASAARSVHRSLRQGHVRAGQDRKPHHRNVFCRAIDTMSSMRCRIPV
jgi:hypothetical protein